MREKAREKLNVAFNSFAQQRLHSTQIKFTFNICTEINCSKNTIQCRSAKAIVKKKYIYIKFTFILGCVFQV